MMPNKTSDRQIGNKDHTPRISGAQLMLQSVQRVQDIMVGLPSGGDDMRKVHKLGGGVRLKLCRINPGVPSRTAATHTLLPA